jgi:hypothetical protein
VKILIVIAIITALLGGGFMITRSPNGSAPASATATAAAVTSDSASIAETAATPAPRPPKGYGLDADGVPLPGFAMGEKVLADGSRVAVVEKTVRVVYKDGVAVEFPVSMVAHELRFNPEKVANADELMRVPEVRAAVVAWDNNIKAQRERLAANDYNANVVVDGGVAVSNQSGVTPEQIRQIDAAVNAPKQGCWREEPVNPDAPYTGPGQRLPNGDIVLDGRGALPKTPARVQRPPVIPDPVGLGERLVLIDTLGEKFGVDKTLLVGCSVEDLVVMYWGEVKKTGRPAPYPEKDAD